MRATSSAPNWPPPRRTSITNGATIARAIAASVVSTAIVSRFLRNSERNPARSPSALAADPRWQAAVTAARDLVERPALKLEGDRLA